jgi:NAD(P)-dependent dehydrogenase (short-subunit alcohol dehydrogenase family)
MIWKCDGVGSEKTETMNTRNGTVLITGASSGIGKATAKAFATNGWNVVATMRNPAAETELAQLNGVMVTRLDVQEHTSIDGAVKAGIGRFGRIDVLINNAGFSLAGVFESISREKIQEQFDVNVFGVMEVTRAVLPHFRKNKGGLIINISSRAGLVALPMLTLYSASKFALEAFSESLAYELASQNVGVKVVEPSGGASGTNFGKRMTEERALGASLSDYDEFVAQTNAVFAGMRATRMAGADEVAQVIFGAATDGTEQFRYFVGEDTGDLVRAKREMKDQDFIDFMRARFQLKA